MCANLRLLLSAVQVTCAFVVLLNQPLCCFAVHIRLFNSLNKTPRVWKHLVQTKTTINSFLPLPPSFPVYLALQVILFTKLSFGKGAVGRLVSTSHGRSRNGLTESRAVPQEDGALAPTGTHCHPLSARSKYRWKPEALATCRKELSSRPDHL